MARIEKAVDVITWRDVQALGAVRDGARVSIYLPTHRVWTETPQDARRLKNLLREADEQLVEAGVRASLARDLLAPAAVLVEQEDFWRYQSDGLALFLAEDVVVQGEIRYGTGHRIGRGLLIFGLVFGLGAVIAVMLSGLVAAAVAPHGVRAAGAALTDEFGKTLLAALVVWVGLPLVAFVAFVTVIGIPTGLGILLFLLPALGFLGYLIAGIRLGDYVLGVARGSDEAWHPYLAAVVGLCILLVAGWIPVVGSVVTPVAAFLGAGALALHAWKAVRRPSMQGAIPSPL